MIEKRNGGMTETGSFGMKAKLKGWDGICGFRFKRKKQARRTLRNYARFVLGKADKKGEVAV